MVFGIGSSAKANRRAVGASAEPNSPATAVLLFLGIGSIAIVGLCGGLFYFLQPHVSEDPADVRTLMDELLVISIPTEPDAAPVVFEPRGTIRWNIAFMMSLRGAYYETQDDQLDGLLMFLEVTGASLDKPEVREHVDRILRERSDGKIQLQPGSFSETRTLDVRGFPTPITFETGVHAGTSESYRLVTAIVPAKRDGEVLIALRVKQAPPWNDEIAVRMIESIR
jgi:hypothetical protein